MTSTIKLTRQRSPNFPYTNLDRAIELCRILYKSYRKTFIPIDTAIKTVELSPKSSKAKQIMAALSAFNLLETEGVGDNRKVKISDLGYSIIIDERPNSHERDKYLRDAALSPNIFRTIYEKFLHNMPSDEVLSHELKMRHNFNPDSVAVFIKVYKQTMDFAKIYESGSSGGITPTESQLTDVYDKSGFVPSPPPLRSASCGDKTTIISLGNEREIANYPIGRGLKARIIVSGECQVSLEAIEKLIKLLELNKEDLSETHNHYSSN